MNILVIGANGGSGRAAARELLARGHKASGMTRRPDRLADELPGLDVIEGDATDPAAIDRAVAGRDAVVITLGITESPLLVRLRGARHTALDVRSRGTRLAIEAMQRHDVNRLVVQTTYGIGDTDGHLTTSERVLFRLLLKPQIADSVQQEAAVRQSGLDWTLSQPVHLTDDTIDHPPAVNVGTVVDGRKVSRAQVAIGIADALDDDATIGCSLAVSGGSAKASRSVAGTVASGAGHAVRDKKFVSIKTPTP